MQSIANKAKKIGGDSMGKSIDYEFDYMDRDDIVSHITVYKDGSVDIENFTDNKYLLPFLFNGVTREDVEDMFARRVFDIGRPDKYELLKQMGVPFYDPLMIILRTRGVMLRDHFWIRFNKEDTWEKVTSNLRKEGVKI